MGPVRRFLSNYFHLLLRHIVDGLNRSHHYHAQLCVFLVYLYSNGDEIEFYIQLQRLTNVTSSHVDVTVELYRITHTQTADVTRSAVVYRHQVSDVTYLRYLLVQLGGISYRHGVLCWAPVDSVVCAKLARSEGRLKDAQTVVDTAQVEQICQGC